MSQDSTDRIQVVIVGGGPSGLAAAIELGSRGIRCLLVERDTRAGWAPRAKTTHTRTREHLRRWGIADKLAAASPFGVDYPSHIVFCTRLSGPLLTRFEHGLNCSPARDERYSEHGQWIPQYKLEQVLRDHARTLPAVQVVFGQEYLSFEQDAAEVRVRIRDVESGAERVVRADFLIGADGARSRVRDHIGAKMEGTYGLSRNYNTIFYAPGLAQAHRHGPAIMYWQINPEVPGLLGPMDEGDLWFFMPTQIPPGITYAPNEVLDLIRRSTGIDLPYEVRSSDEWIASRLLADRYRDRRVFLTGDACHLHPPFGGFGMNMGIADSVDLGWKLAACLQGWGGAGLLDSYEVERRQSHEFVLDEAEGNHAVLPNTLWRDGIEEMSPRGDALRAEVGEVIQQAKKREFFALGVVLGYRYAASPVIVDDGTGIDWVRSRDYVPSAIPGCLAPHRWLADGRSLYDLFGGGFTLLVLGDGDGEVDAACREAEASGTPLTVLRLTDPHLPELYQARLALIRPDQHVAWRGNAWPDKGIFGRVTGRG